MSGATQFYVSGLFVLLFINIIAVWGLDLQYGVAGIYNFGFVMFQGAGAYATAVLSLRPASAYMAGETYVGGLHWPFPLPLIGAVAAGALLAVPLGLVAVRRLRGDYQAMAMLVLSLIATGYVRTTTGLFNGTTGISSIPHPLGDLLNLSDVNYQWFYAGLTGVVCAMAFFFMRRVVSSPFGRVLRAVRDSDSAAAALGRRSDQAKMVAFVIGGGLGGLSGGLLANYVTAWSPQSWLYPETFLLFTAIVVGGSRNLAGNALGVLLVPILILEGTRYLPEIGYPGLTASLDWIVIGVVLLGFLWWRPRGLLPERVRGSAWFGRPSGRRFGAAGVGVVSSGGVGDGAR